MSEIPQAWVEKAAQTIYREARGAFNSTEVARAVLAAVLPDVRRAVAEEIAAAIKALPTGETQGTPWVADYELGYIHAQMHAVRIAREAGGPR